MTLVDDETHFSSLICAFGFTCLLFYYYNLLETHTVFSDFESLQECSLKAVRIRSNRVSFIAAQLYH